MEPRGDVPRFAFWRLRLDGVGSFALEAPGCDKVLFSGYLGVGACSRGIGSSEKKDGLCRGVGM